MMYEDEGISEEAMRAACERLARHAADRLLGGSVFVSAPQPRSWLADLVDPRPVTDAAPASCPEPAAVAGALVSR